MKTYKKGEVVRVQIGRPGERGYKINVPATIFDTSVGEFNVKQYWFRVLGLCVVGRAIAQKGPDDLFCSIANHVAYAGQQPARKDVSTEAHALAYLGYQV